MKSGVLNRTLTATQFFTISFAAIVGVGWIVVLGEWLREAGPVGAIFAFLAAGVLVMVIGACYAEICTSIPAAGGEMAYAYAAFGTKACFAIGWILALVYISATAFEGLSAGWLAGILFPPLAGRPLYYVDGIPVKSGTLILGIGGTLLLTALNCRGMRSSGRFQAVATWTKIGISVILVAAGILWGHTENLQPWFAGENRAGALHATLVVLVTAPFWLGGFNTIAQVMEERAQNVSYASIVTALLASIAAASIFYALLILSASMAMPWPQITQLEFPAIGAFAAALHSMTAAKIALLGGLIGLLATWNSVFIASSRVLYALSRAGMIRSELAHVSAGNGAPAVAVAAVGLLSGAGILLGRSALLPIINVDSSCFMLTYATVALAVIRMRRLQPDRERPFGVPGGELTAAVVLIVTILMFGESMYLPWVARSSRVPIEWFLFVGWLAIGVFVWALSASSRAKLTARQRRELIVHE
jgi:basic amino acid/polyamine antiporter, APA family